jgi:ribose transport system substrate-binding protein
MLNRFKAADGTLAVDGVFCPNESTTMGMLRVLEDSGWAGKVKFVGFDASDSLVKALESGHIDALVVQDPVKMGYLGVKTLVAHISGGGSVEPRIDTGAQLVTHDKMNDPAIKELLHPDLARWLK